MRTPAVEAWQAVLASLGVALFIAHVAALAGGAYITHNWSNAYTFCVWAPGSWLLGAGVIVVLLPFLISGLHQMAPESEEKSAFLVWLTFTAIEVVGAVTLFKWAPLSCTNTTLWWIAATLFILDGLLWLLLCFSPIFFSQIGGYRVVLRGYQPTYYQSVPTSV